MVNDLEAEPRAVAGRLRPVLLRLARELRRELADLGVSGGQASLLHAIRTTPGVGVNDLAAAERMSAAAMSGYVRRLEDAGLVARAPHPEDARRQTLALTPAGDRILRLVRSRRTAWLTARLDRLDGDELRAVDAAIEPLTKLLEAGG